MDESIFNDVITHTSSYRYSCESRGRHRFTFILLMNDHVDPDVYMIAHMIPVMYGREMTSVASRQTLDERQSRDAWGRRRSHYGRASRQWSLTTHEAPPKLITSDCSLKLAAAITSRRLKTQTNSHDRWGCDSGLDRVAGTCTSCTCIA